MRKESVEDHDTVDESGFVEGNETIIKLDESFEEVVIVDDDVFSSFERLVEEQNKYLEDKCRSLDCYVKMFNFSVEYEDEVDSLNAAEEDFEPACNSTPQRSLRKRLISGVKLKDSDEDSGIEESPQKIAVKKKKKKPNFSYPDNYEMSAYEKIREDNIKEREEMLKSLGIKEAFADYKNDVGLTSKLGGTRKRKFLQTDRRRSSRLEEQDDVDYVPEGEDNDDRYATDDPTDHTHDGLRKHPCKECFNCTKTDCRRCIFCKDKRKYGGPNIKKQKCELKQKCSNPIVLCFICKGQRSFSCNECSKQFHEMFQLEEHKQHVHQVETVRRKSLRINRKDDI